MRKALVLGLLLLVSAPQMAVAADTGSKPVVTPTPMATPTSTPTPIATPTPTPMATPTSTSTSTPTPMATPISTPTPIATPTSTPTSTPTPIATAEVKTVIGELTKARSMIALKDYSSARMALKVIDRDFPNNADVNNLLGFTSRKLRLYAVAATYYTKALAINPKHLGALEYQGELFVETFKFDLAKKNLAKLKQLCGVKCEEYLDLKKAIGKR